MLRHLKTVHGGQKNFDLTSIWRRIFNRCTTNVTWYIAVAAIKTFIIQLIRILNYQPPLTYIAEYWTGTKDDHVDHLTSSLIWRTKCDPICRLGRSLDQGQGRLKRYIMSRANIFYQQSCYAWHDQPNSIFLASCVNSFMKRLDKFRHSQNGIFSYKENSTGFAR